MRGWPTRQAPPAWPLGGRRPPSTRPGAAASLRLVLVCALLTVGSPALVSGAQAVTAQATPVGPLDASVRQLNLVFSAPVAALGQTQSPAPAALRCEGQAPASQGRWADDRTWVLEFPEPLPAGLRCTLRIDPRWRPAQGRLGGSRAFEFSTGGPRVDAVLPWPGSEVEEDAHFLLRLNGAPVDDHVRRHAGCEVEGLAERIPARVVTGPVRAQLLALERQSPAAEAADHTLVLRCERPLPQGAKVRLVWGSGIGAQRNPSVLTREAQAFDFQVRPAFTAEFSCERERAEAPCLPIRPMVLRFSSPVARALAMQARLLGAGAQPIGPHDDADDLSEEVSQIVFPPVRVERATLRLELPADLQDATARPLANAASFPLTVRTGDAPPLARFAAAPFGIVEWGPQAAVPLTLRRVQGELAPGAVAGQLRARRMATPGEVIGWYSRLWEHHETWRTARELGMPQAGWYEQRQDTDADGRTVTRRVARMVHTREVSLLSGDPQSRRVEVPAVDATGAQALEVVGVPIAEPGYHVLEIESSRLGRSLLGTDAPMYVRTGVLVTNLGVHFKHGRASSVAWVTSLDRGIPVADAQVQVHDCTGRRLWGGRTDRQGLAHIAQPLPEAEGKRCLPGVEGLFVTASHTRDDGLQDLAFVLSQWDRGIEGWRFGLPVSRDPDPDDRAHTVFDRTLVRVGDTVSMKHFLRLHTATGLAWPARASLPSRVRIEHVGSGSSVTLPLAWDGVRSALSAWKVPVGAALGSYRVLLERAPGDERPGAGVAAPVPGPADPARSWPRQWPAGEFRVEAFRVPLVDARLAGPAGALVAPSTLSLDVQLNHLSGGGVATSLKLSAVLRDRAPSFAGYEDFVFEPGRPAAEGGEDPQGRQDEGARGRVVADKVGADTTREGAARVVLPDLPPVRRPGEIVAEASFADPNGETQTVGTTLPVWPATVVPGIRASWWVAPGGASRLSAIALDTAGRPLANQPLEVRAQQHQWVSTRRRVVGGFYAWSHRTVTRDLGVVCSGRSDARGLLDCDPKLQAKGEIELTVSATDPAGRQATAATRVWRQGGGDGETWFAPSDDDRIELLPERRRVEPGQTARIQVRMPFRHATALVAVEREGVIDTRVVTLRGDDPVVELEIRPEWAPNVYVSVLAVRGRLRDTSWRALFGGGWREPLAWARERWYEHGRWQRPTATIDLAKPSFRLGAVALEVGTSAHALQVAVMPERDSYRVRETARVRLRVSHDGQPAAGAELAFAAVDEALLELRGNDSWDLLGAMMQPRPWGVATSTGQGEIIGRRHHGRKTLPVGGDAGGRGGTRELFDTLLTWQPRVALDARGEAVVEVPLNDALTRFRLVAVADAGISGSLQRFGTGSASVRVTQDLQVLSGLPALVREGDRYDATLTLRNTTARPMSVRVALQGTVAAGVQGALPLIELPARQLTLAPGTAAEAVWPVTVPAGATGITWLATADEMVPPGAAARMATDRLRQAQKVTPAVPVDVVQATLRRWPGRGSLSLAAPADALALGGAAPGGVPAGGITIALQPRLGAALPGIRRYFETYPYTCLEQQVSRAVVLGDQEAWRSLGERLPAYLDADGLAGFYPRSEGESDQGSDRLTAYLLATAHEAGLAWPEALRERMLAGLSAFVEGRIERSFWSPQPDLEVRRITAIEALARHGRAAARMTDVIEVAPSRWPTSAVIDWLSLLRRLDDHPQRERLVEQAQQVLRGRLSWSGTTLRFQRESQDAWWWLMESADANAARLILAVIDDPAWADDLPRLVTGSLGRQRGGAWSTTTANAWGALALERFGSRMEDKPVAGRTTVTMTAPAPPQGTAPQATATRSVTWATDPQGARLEIGWPGARGTLQWRHEGSGAPWATVQALAAVPLKAPVRAGYAVSRTVHAVQREHPDRWSRGDIARVQLEIEAASDMTWVAVSDPVPGGATILGSGLGRDSALATAGERAAGAPRAYEERTAEAMRFTWSHLPRGRHLVSYTVRLNHSGRFALPPTRVEAMYAPERFGASPNEPWDVGR